MVAYIICHPGSMPQVFIEIDVQTTILKRVAKETLKIIMIRVMPIRVMTILL